MEKISKLLTELATYPPFHLPVFRADEVAAIQVEVRNAAKSIRQLLATHRTTIEQQLSDLQVTQNRLDSQNRPESQSRLDDVEKLSSEVASMKMRLLLLTQPPKVAMIIEISRIQQLKRGLSIYRAMRLKRIHSIYLDTLHKVLSEPSSLTKNFQAPKDLMNKASPAEQHYLRFLSEQLINFGVADTLRDLPRNPKFDHGQAWIEPPLWLASAAKAVLTPEETEPVVADVLKVIQEMEPKTNFKFSDVDLFLPSQEQPTRPSRQKRPPPETDDENIAPQNVTVEETTDPIDPTSVAVETVESSMAAAANPASTESDIRMSG